VIKTAVTATEITLKTSTIAIAVVLKPSSYLPVLVEFEGKQKEKRVMH